MAALSSILADFKESKISASEAVTNMSARGYSQSYINNVIETSFSGSSLTQAQVNSLRTAQAAAYR